MKKLLILIVATLCLSGCNNSLEKKPEETPNSSPVVLSTQTPSTTPSPTPSATPSATPKELLTFGSVFKFDDLEITIGTGAELTAVNNKYSDKNGTEVIKIPIKVKNIKDETHGLNMFNYKLYGSKGTKLDSISSYFDDAIDGAGDMRTGAEIEKFLYIIYDGDGDYYIEFDNYSEKLEVKLPVTK